ncbi:MAG TPA: ribosome small subunit-dependent GTPase A [Acholeplasmataceae bacterium]|jgi:ribosome biogenesis GTPase|nr:ribosome small subunit-dependent GTPase A [Acholeplasmataceae bacterium]
MRKGLIIKSISGDYKVITENNEEFICKPRGLFRYKEKTPKVGDYVDFDDKTKTILKIHPRRNELDRPIIANLDKVFLTFSVKEPDLNLNLLDRLLAIIEYNDIGIVIVFTKLDLLEDKIEFEEIKTYYNKLGYTVYTSGFGLPYEEIKAEVNDNICCFAGQSGVGKSTLLNFFDHTLNLKTAEISEALGRGKHTTRHTELLKVGTGWVADTPGFGNVDFPFDDLLTLSHTFIEFFENSSACKFRLCLHLDEPNCGIKKLVEEGEILKSRYLNYRLFAEELKELQRKKY